ncbi:hypothetical protein WDU94_003034 [Cyamophila willieti]
MDLQSKLENIFRNLVEKESRFGDNNKFISLSVNNLDGSEASDDNSGKIYLGVLKFYDVTKNVFKSISLFVKIQPKGRKHTRAECGDEMIKYDFKFHNEYVAYKHILPFLNQSYACRIEEAVSPFNKVGPKRFSFNDDKENAYTIEEFQNEVRYKEIGKVNKKQYRHSWNHSTYERKRAEEKFFTIKPNSTFALDKCVKYYDRQTEEDAMKRQAHDGIVKFFPEFYHGEINEYEGNQDTNIIVIENMLPAGFHTSNESIFLDKERILLTLRTLGKFHASSYIAKHKNRNEFNKFVNMLRATGWTLPEYWDIYPDFLNQHLLRGIEFLKNDKKYARQILKFDAILKNPKERFFKLMKADENLAVICHGDFCKNNILYKYETSDVEVGNSDLKSFNTYKNPKEVNTLGLETLEKKKNIDDEFCVETYKMETPKRITQEENFTKHFVGLKKDTQLKESYSNSQDVNIFSERLDFHRPKYDTIGCYRKHMDFLDEIPINRINEDQRKENDMKQHSNTINKKRKDFLNNILETNSKTLLDSREVQSSLGAIQNKSIGLLSANNAATKIKRLASPNDQNISIEPPIIASKNTFITGLGCMENEGYGIKNHPKSAKEPFIDPYKKPQEDMNIPSTKSQFENSTKRIAGRELEEKNATSKINETNAIISDRLQYLEEKYRQLEKIYNVNKCVLERKVVNMKIIEKLEEKKQILEEICKKIEKISRKQEMESKLHCSVNKLCQNIDDKETKLRLKSSLPQYSTACDQKKTNTTGNKEPTQKKTITAQQHTAKKAYNTQSVTKSSRISYTSHTKDQTNKSVDEEFNALYEQTFPYEIDSNYEKLYNALSKRASVDEKLESHFTEVNQSIEPNKRCIIGGQIPSMNAKSVDKTNDKNTRPNDINKQCTTTTQCSLNDSDSEYKILSVKERRDNLERSISLSNELKLFDKKQEKTNENKAIKRSNSDVNQIQWNSVSVSERNILLNDQTYDGASEKNAILKDISKGLQPKTRSRIFTDSSWSINEFEEFEESFTNDDVFVATNNTQKVNSDLTSNNIYNKDYLTRSQSQVDLKSAQTRPVPMKRTFSLVGETIASTNHKINRADPANKEKTVPKSNLSCRTRDSFDKKNKLFLDSDDENHESQNQKESKETRSHQSFASQSNTNQQNSYESYRGIYNGRTPPTDNKPKVRILETVPNKENFGKPFSGSKSIVERICLNSQMLRDPARVIPEIIFFDLARMIYASPVIDLSFFLFLNVSHEMRISCWDEFILTYHSSLRSSVPPEVPIPSMADLRKDLKDKCIYGYFLCCFFLPWMMEEHPRQEVDQWIHHGGRQGTEAIANILRFLIDRDMV